MGDLRVRSFAPPDHHWADALLREAWGGVPNVVSRGRVWNPLHLSRFVAELNGESAGVATYRIDGHECELVSINATVEGRGVGGGLVQAVIDRARQVGCVRLWLVTTNDNTRAQRFWRHAGFRLATIHKGAITESRRLKPQIPRYGHNGVPIDDEWEFEMILSLLAADQAQYGSGSAPNE